MASIFTRIVNGEIPCHKIAETNDFLAFLDISPLAEGHTLVIPKQEIDYLFDLPEGLYLGLMAFARNLVPALEKACPCERIGVAVVGLEVPHAHIHLIPMNNMNDINFKKEKLKFSSEQLAQIAEKIRANINF
jgi:histidine triad (HIT) family protein